MAGSDSQAGSTRVLTADDLDADLVGQWRALLEGQPHLDSPFQTPDFFLCLARHRPDARVLARFTEDGRVAALLPFHARAGGVARPLGGPFSDVQAVIAARGTAIDGPGWLREAGLASFRFTGLIDPEHVFDTGPAWLREPAYATTLTGPAEAFLETRRAAFPKHFKKLRRLARNAASAHGEVRLVAEDARPEAYERLMAWKRAQYAASGRHDVLNPAWADGMMRDLFASADPRFGGRLTTLWFGDRLAAAEFNLRAGAVLHGWIVAYDPELAEFMPGHLLVARLIEAMPELGLTRYDMGPGGAHAKKYYANVEPLRANGVAAASDWRGGVHAVRHRLVRAAETAPLGPASQLIGKTRRRFDQIVSAELTVKGRLIGIRRALAARLPNGGS